MKYKPCCEKRCLLDKCEVRDQGGCYCLCKLSDMLIALDCVEKGNTIVSGGCIYYPEKEKALSYLKNLPLERQKEHERFVENIPHTRKEIEKKIKTYELKENE